MSIKNALEARWTQVLEWVQFDKLPELRDFINSNDPTKSKSPLHQRRLNSLLSAAACSDSEKCMQYLAQALGGDIHHVEAPYEATTLALAIYCSDNNRRACMFTALMNLADANTLDELAPKWIMALRSALWMGDDLILGELARFIGPRRFADWTAAISELDGGDAWHVVARGGNMKIVSILLAIPEMRARFEKARSPKGHDLARLAHEAGKAEFAQSLLCLVAADRDRAALEDACPAAKAGSRGLGGRM